MKKLLLPKAFNALPPYMGGKRRLLPWLFQTLSKAAPPSTWNDLTFLDTFVGGGAVSLFAKVHNFKQIHCNDWSERSQIVIKGLLENQSKTLSKEEVALLARPLETLPGFIQQHFCPSVFSSRHAEALDRLLTNTAQFHSPIKQALGRLLVWHLIRDFVCMATSIGSSNRPYAETLDGLRDWQELNSKRFLDNSFPNLLKPTWHTLEKRRQAINKGVFTGSPVQGFQMNAIDFVGQTQGDILYADPPYPGCLSYESTNRVLDSILTRDLEPGLSTSSFTKGTQALEDLLDNAKHIPIWLISYGNNQVSLEELVTLVKRHCPQRQIEASARDFKHLPHVSRNSGNQELLVMAY